MAKLEDTLIEMARLQGHTLNNHDLLQLRTQIASCLSAKERHRQRMEAAPFEWKKPQKPRH